MVIVAILDGVWGVTGVAGSGLPGVRGRIHLRGLATGSAESGEISGDIKVLEAVSDDVEEPELDEAMELPVPRRTNWRRPTTGDVKRDGEAKPDAEYSGVCGGEVGVAQGRAVVIWYSFFTTIRVMCRFLRASLLDVYSSVLVSCGGRLCASRIDLPASRGDDMRCFESDMIGVPFHNGRKQNLGRKWLC